MITCEHTSTAQNVLQNGYIDTNSVNGEDDLLSVNGELTNEQILITNNSLHNNEIGLGHKKQPPFMHSHNANINGDLKGKPPQSLFIYPNLIYVCEVFKGSRLIRTESTTLNNSSRHGNSTFFGEFSECPTYRIRIRVRIIS